MSARIGFGPGNIDCGDVLDELSVFLDDETDDATKTRIAVHLDACSPCLRELGLEKDVRALINRCCGGDRAPEGLRTRISVRITEISVVE